MSGWTHAICAADWEANRPGQTPVRVTGVGPEPCCLCGAETTAGIYFRQDPERTPCGGRHPE